MAPVLIVLAILVVMLLAVFSDNGSLPMRVAAALLAVVVLITTGCGRKDVKPDVPRGVIVKPQPVTVTRTVYVAVPAELTDPLPIAEGPLNQCPDVAAARREALKRANADRAKVRALSGAAVKP